MYLLVLSMLGNEIIEGYFNGLIAGLEKFLLIYNKGIVTCDTQKYVLLHIFNPRFRGKIVNCAGGTLNALSFCRGKYDVTTPESIEVRNVSDQE